MTTTKTPTIQPDGSLIIPVNDFREHVLILSSEETQKLRKILNESTTNNKTPITAKAKYPKVAVIDSPIRCPHYHEDTCFHPSKKDSLVLYARCGWHQGMPKNAFPANCPLPDAPDPVMDIAPICKKCANGVPTKAYCAQHLPQNRFTATKEFRKSCYAFKERKK